MIDNMQLFENCFRSKIYFDTTVFLVLNTFSQQDKIFSFLAKKKRLHSVLGVISIVHDFKRENALTVLMISQFVSKFQICGVSVVWLVGLSRASEDKSCQRCCSNLKHNNLKTSSQHSHWPYALIIKIWFDTSPLSSKDTTGRDVDQGKMDWY